MLTAKRSQYHCSYPSSSHSPRHLKKCTAIGSRLPMVEDLTLFRWVTNSWTRASNNSETPSMTQTRNQLKAHLIWGSSYSTKWNCHRRRRIWYSTVHLELHLFSVPLVLAIAEGSCGLPNLLRHPGCTMKALRSRMVESLSGWGVLGTYRRKGFQRIFESISTALNGWCDLRCQTACSQSITPILPRALP